MTEIIETKEQRVLHVEIKPNVDTPARSFDLALPFFWQGKEFLHPDHRRFKSHHH